MKKINTNLLEEETREQQIERINEASRISNMIPIWKDRNIRRRRKISTYDHSLKNRLAWLKEMSSD
jgi:hypothetical protein